MNFFLIICEINYLLNYRFRKKIEKENIIRESGKKVHFICEKQDKNSEK